MINRATWEPCSACGSPDGAAAQFQPLGRGHSVVPTFVRTSQCWVCGAEKKPLIIRIERRKLAS